MLFGSNSVIKIVTDATAATTEPTIALNYLDYLIGQNAPVAGGPFDTAASTTGTTPLQVVGSPASGNERQPTFIVIYNPDTVARTITLQKVTGSTVIVLFSATMQPKDQARYAFGQWEILTLASGTKVSNVANVAIGSPISGGSATAVLFLDSSGNLDQDSARFNYSASGPVLNLEGVIGDGSFSSVDVLGRKLYNELGTEAASFGSSSGQLITSGVTIVDWTNGFLLDLAATDSVDWFDRLLSDGVNQQSVDWENRLMYDNSSVVSLDWTNRALLYTDGVIATIDWVNCALNDVNGNLSVDWSFGRTLVDTNGLTIVAAYGNGDGSLRVNNTLRLGVGSSVTGIEVLYNSSNSNTVSISAGITSASYTLKWPLAQGAAGTFTQNDGSGILSFAKTIEPGLFGDASDGSLVFDGTTTILGMVPSGNVYTMTRSISASAITINTGVTLKPAGFDIRCAGSLTNSGTISDPGTNATGTGTGTGTALAAVESTATGGAGSNGGAGSATTGGNGNGSSAAALFSGGAGGAGGAGLAGVNAGGTGGTYTGVLKSKRWLTDDMRTVTSTYSTGGGLGGGAGGGDGTTGPAGGAGGGASRGFYIWCGSVNNTGTISANGGNGFNGGNGAGTNQGGGGGGGGGSGGQIQIVAETVTAWGTITATGGTKGTGGSKTGTGVAGSDGSNGNAGAVLKYLVGIGFQ